MQLHDLITFICGLTLGALAAHFHPGTQARKKRSRAIPRGTAQEGPRKAPGRPRKAPQAPADPLPMD